MTACSALWAVVVVATLIGSLVSGRAMRRELAWLANLPFPVAGYVEALQLAATTAATVSSHSHNATTYPAVETVTVGAELVEPIESQAFAANLLSAWSLSMNGRRLPGLRASVPATNGQRLWLIVATSRCYTFVSWIPRLRYRPIG